MEYTNGLGSEDLNTFTTCLRFNVKFLRPIFAHLHSYSTFISDNTLLSTLGLQYDNKLSLKICKYVFVTKVTTFCTIHKMKSVKIHDQWHHFCWLFNADEINKDQIQVSTKLFLNGKQVKQGDFPKIDSFIIHTKYNDIDISISLYFFSASCRCTSNKQTKLPSFIHKWIISSWPRFRWESK